MFTFAPEFLQWLMRDDAWEKRCERGRESASATDEADASRAQGKCGCGGWLAYKG